MEISTVSLSLPTDVYQQLQSVATDERISPIKLIELLLRERRHNGKTKRRSVIEILAATPGHQIFQSAEQVNAYLAEEKEAWDN